MSAVETAAVDWFKTNVRNVFHELASVADFRHEWEATRLHTAIDNLEADPTSLLQKLEPTAPTVGQEDVRLVAMQTTIDALTAKLDQVLAAQNPAANTAPVASTPVVSPPVTGDETAAAPAQPVNPTVVPVQTPGQ